MLKIPEEPFRDGKKMKMKTLKIKDMVIQI